MEDSYKQSMPQTIAQAIRQVLKRNSIAALATLVEAREGVGAKLLVEETGERHSSLGSLELDETVASFAPLFLHSRAEAQTFKLVEIADDVSPDVEGRVLFERIEPEPRLVICGAGHVGASLAR